MRLRAVLLVGVSLVGLWAYAGFAPLPAPIDRAAAEQRMREATAEKYPDADTISVGRLTYKEYRPDGTYRQWGEDYVKALTEEGAKSLVKQASSYTEGRSETAFLVAEIIAADGTVRPVEIEKYLSIATDNRSLDENIYDDTQKVLTLTLPEVKVGDTVHVVIADNFNKVRIPDSFADVSLMEYSEPIPYLEYTVVAPKELPLRSIEVVREVPGTLTQMRETLEDGRTKWRWIAQNVPQIHEEERMPNIIGQVQGVQVSTFGSWEEISQWYWGLCVPHMEMTDAIRAKVKELVAKATDDMGKIREIFRFVSQDVRYMGVIAEDKAPGYEPHDIALTFDNRYGVCRDKGVLLVAMLREAGYDAYPVLISAGIKMVDKVPIPYFNHAVVAIDMGAKDYLMMDPTDENTRDLFPSYLGDCPFVVCRPDGDTLRMTPVTPAEDSLLTVKTDALIGPLGALDLQVRVDCAGINDNMYRTALMKQTPEQLRKFFEGIFRSILPGATLVELKTSPENAQDITQPVVLEFVVRVDSFVNADDKGDALITLPLVSSRFGLVRSYLRGLVQPERRFDWEITTPAMVRETLTVRGIEHLGTAKLLPEDTTLAVNGAKYALTTKMDGAKAWVITREVALTKKTYTPPEYQALRQFAERISRVEGMRALFAKATTSDADMEILNSATTYAIKDAKTASVRSAVDRKILTYAGTKAYAEQTIAFRPAYDKVTLNRVAVTRVDGEVQALDEARESHTFDIGYTSDAPRYPALKQKVLTLPAVQVGAITHVDTTVESRVRTPQYAYTFGGEDPIRKESLTVSFPMALGNQVCIRTNHMDALPMTYEIVVDKDIVSHTWTVTNPLRLAKEDAAVGLSFEMPTVAVYMKEATAERLYTELAAAFDAALDETDAVEEAVEAIEGSEDARLRAVQRFMAERFQQLGPAWQAFPEITVSPADETLQAGYGNRLDNLAVWAAALDELGIETELVLAENGSPAVNRLKAQYTLEVGDRQWTTPYLRLEDGRLIGDESKYDEPGACLLKAGAQLLTAEGIQTYTPPSGLARNDTDTIRRIIVHPNGDATVTLERHAYGLAAGSLRKIEAETLPEARKRMVAAMANSVLPGAEAHSKYFVDTAAYPVHSRFTVYVRNFAVRSGKMFTLKLPLGTGLYGLRGQHRTRPIGLMRDETLTMPIELWLPKGAQVVLKPEAFDYTLPGGGAVSLKATAGTTAGSGLPYFTYTEEVHYRPAVLEPYMQPALSELDRLMQLPTQSTVIYTLQ